MCLTPWSASAWTTIWAPVICFSIVRPRFRPAAPHCHSGNKKGPRGPSARTTYRDGSCHRGGALRYYENELARHWLFPVRSVQNNRAARPGQWRRPDLDDGGHRLLHDDLPFHHRMETAEI